MSRSTSERGLGFRLLGLLVGAGVAVALALASAHYYSAPTLNGAAPGNSWLELDFFFAAMSSLVGLGVGLLAGRVFAQTRVDAVLVRALIWLTLTILLAAVWGNSVSLLTLLIAPSHAFACLRLASLGRAWRSERLWRK